VTIVQAQDERFVVSGAAHEPRRAGRAPWRGGPRARRRSYRRAARCALAGRDPRALRGKLRRVGGAILQWRIDDRERGENCRAARVAPPMCCESPLREDEAPRRDSPTARARKKTVSRCAPYSFAWPQSMSHSGVARVDERGAAAADIEHGDLPLGLRGGARALHFRRSKIEVAAWERGEDFHHEKERLRASPVRVVEKRSPGWRRRRSREARRRRARGSQRRSAPRATFGENGDGRDEVKVEAGGRRASRATRPALTPIDSCRHFPRAPPGSADGESRAGAAEKESGWPSGTILRLTRVVQRSSTSTSTNEKLKAGRKRAGW